MENRNRFVEIN